MCMFEGGLEGRLLRPALQAGIKNLKPFLCFIYVESVYLLLTYCFCICGILVVFIVFIRKTLSGKKQNEEPIKFLDGKMGLWYFFFHRESAPSNKNISPCLRH